MRVVVLGDAHFPAVDRRAWGLALSVIETVKPSHVVQVGDFCDMDALSMHPAEFGRKSDLDDEITSAAAGMRELQKSAGKASVVLLEGNHETRLQRYLATNAKKVENQVKTFPEMLGFKGKFVPYQTPFQIGKVFYLHDAGHAGVQACQQTLQTVGHCVVFGHTHRAGVAYDGNADATKRRFAMNVGWLGDRRFIKYAPPSRTRAWQHGVGVVDYDGQLAWANFVPFVNGRAMVDGKKVAA